MSDLLASAAAECRPYRTVDGGTMYPGRDDAQSLVRRLGLTNPAGYYRRILGSLGDRERFDVRTMVEAAAAPVSDRVLVSIRHDMDTEPYSSVEAARALRAAGLRGSFYVLHTAEYYGRWRDGLFERCDAIAPILREMQDECGCEIGLHTDGLWVYQRWQADGAQAIAAELAWLRGAGLRIAGTAAHNSAPVYGAENFELFAGRSVRRACTAPDGSGTPLQVLDERGLGLEYEANAPELESDGLSRLEAWMRLDPADPVRDEQWMRTYLVEHPICRWGADYNFWLIGADRWAIGGHRLRNGAFAWDATLDDVVRFMAGLPRGARMVVHIHPLYIDFAAD